MRIAFDLDDTLIPCGRRFDTESARFPFVARAFHCEPLRRGTTTLLRTLTSMGWEIWVYTSSFRSPLSVRLTFLSYGFWLSGVVNQSTHDQKVDRNHRRFPKYPPAFGIDLLVDNCAIPCHPPSFHMVVVQPRDLDWSEKVLTEARRISQR